MPKSNPQSTAKSSQPPASWALPATYAVGDAGFNLYWATAESFLLFFYTDVDQLTPAHVAFVLLLGRLVDLVAGPVIGIVADRTRTRVGSYRPYLIALAIPLGLSATLLFSKPSIWPLGLGRLASLPDGPVFMVALSSSLFALCYSTANVPYTALLSVVTDDAAERTRFASLRFAFAATAGLIVQYSTLTIVARLSTTSAARGWQHTLLLYSIPASVALLICGLFSRERVPADSAEVGVSLALGKLFRNSTWWWCILAIMFSLAAFSCRSAASPFYLKYFILRPGAGGLFLASNSAAALVSCLLVSARPSILQSKTRLALACSFMGAAVTSWLLLIPPDHWALLLLLQIAFGLTTGALVPAIFSIFSDLPQSVQAFQGISVIGIIAASSLLAIKIGAMAGLGLVSLTLWIVHYQPSAGPTSVAGTAIRLLMSVVPAILLLASGIALIAVRRSLNQSASIVSTSPA